MVLPVYNNRHQMVAAKETNHIVQSVISEEDALNLGVWKDISEHTPPAPQSRNVGNERRQNRRNRN